MPLGEGFNSISFFFSLNLLFNYYLSYITETHFEILTVQNIVEELKHLSNKWIEIAEHLQIPSSVINTLSVIEMHREGDTTPLQDVIEWWFVNCHNPEWATIHLVASQLEMGKSIQVFYNNYYPIYFGCPSSSLVLPYNSNNTKA